MKDFVVLACAILFTFSSVFAQKRSKLIFKSYPESYFKKTIEPSLAEYEAKKKPTSTGSLKMDVSGLKFPNTLDLYQTVWHNKPISQGNTGTCWCFSSTSFIESEVKRLTGKEIKLSEMYFVYYEYVERAKYFVETRGEMSFGEGSEVNAMLRLLDNYGAVPATVYAGKPEGMPFYAHNAMFNEIQFYLNNVKTTGAWNEEQVVNTVKSILNFHMGTPPRIFKYNQTDYNPESFRDKILTIKADNYVNFMSLMQNEFYKKAEFNVPDNWWHSDDYFNIPLGSFMTGIDEAIQKGFSIAIGGDVSEAGILPEAQVAVIPDFDIPSSYINDESRQFRFSNQTSTDDHAMHIVGIYKSKGETWYLVKDSGSGSRNCGETCSTFGYYFFHADFVRLKILNFTVHKDAVADILKQCKS